MDDAKQRLKELTRKSLNLAYEDIRITDEGYRVTIQIARKGSDIAATITVSVPRSGKQVRAKKWDKSPEEIKEEARRALASFGEALATL